MHKAIFEPTDLLQRLENIFIKLQIQLQKWLCLQKRFFEGYKNMIEKFKQKFHPTSILTRLGKVEFLIYCVLK